MPVMIHYASVDDYIAAQPKEMQPKLKQMRRAIKAVIPKAEEVISYCMPAFKQDGIVVWYAATKKHFALYPKTNVITAFKKELEPYAVAKGTIRFPIDQPLPLDLIQDIVRFRVAENKESTAAKSTRIATGKQRKSAKPQTLK
ncbi:MAG TPA: DUF1801 domain-containing protein [Flavisolibacter sp.]